MLERCYRRTKTSTDRLAWTTQVRTMHALYKQKQNLYWQSKVNESQGSPKKLWKVLNSILCKKRDRSIKSNVSDGMNASLFTKAFSDKIAGVRASTSTAPPAQFDGIQCPSELNRFAEVDQEVVVGLIRSAANKNSMLDPVPIWIVKQYCEDLAPFVTRLFNASLKNGRFPASQKCACVTPVLKKATLDPDDPCNYRPISNLAFISKLLERCVYEQTNTYL